MALKPETAKITDLKTTFDAVPVASVEGRVIWADVWIDYALSGLAPTVTIRVPIPWNERDTPEERKAMALHCARQLIDHACRASAMGGDQMGVGDRFLEEPLEAATPSALEDFVQELGLAKPTTQPRRQTAQNPRSRTGARRIS